MNPAAFRDSQKHVFVHVSVRRDTNMRNNQSEMGYFRKPAVPPLVNRSHPLRAFPAKHISYICNTTLSASLKNATLALEQGAEEGHQISWHVGNFYKPPEQTLKRIRSSW